MTPAARFPSVNSMQGTPETLTIEVQRDWWNDWNKDHRSGPPGVLMRRQTEAAVDVARRIKPDRILDVGCGTGWLGAELTGYGKVTGIDLAEQAIAAGRLQFPGVDLRSGDFSTMPLEKGYDLIVSADTLAHVEDQPAFVSRIAELLKPGGTFLLMTQNKFVWERSSYVSPQGVGQIRRWSYAWELGALLGPHFEIESMRTIEPGGDLRECRFVRWVVNRWTAWVPGIESVKRTFEGIGLGREIVVEARKR